MAFRFQHVKRGEIPDNFETIPFYQDYIRGFLAEHDGFTAWFKGNSGGEQAAYLVIDTSLVNEATQLLTVALADGGNYRMTSEPEPLKIVEKFYHGKTTVGRLDLVEYEQPLGQRVPKESGNISLPDFRSGFWLAWGGNPHATHLRAETCRVEGEEFVLTNAHEDYYRTDGSISKTFLSPEFRIEISRIAGLELNDAFLKKERAL